METYLQQKARHENEFSAFEGIFFAFNSGQLEEGLQKIKATKEEIVSIGYGGFVRKDQAKAFLDLMTRHDNERKQLRKDRKALIDGILYELGNHEFGYTGDPSDALAVFDLTTETIDAELWREVLKKYRKQEKAVA